MAQTPDWTRVLQLNSTSAPAVNLVTADANNVYMAVTIGGPVTFEGIKYTSIGFNDLLLVKMSNTGVTEWAKQFNAQSGGFITPNAIKVDENGNIYVAATFTGTITVGVEPVTSSALINSIFVKFDSSGKRIWATSFYNNGTGSSKIALDGSGNSFLLSKTNKLMKFNNSGNILWGQDFTDKTLQAITVLGSNLYLGGALQDQVTHFGTIDLTKLAGQNTGFVVKADLDGLYSKGIVVGGSTTGEGSAVSDMVADNSGNLMITGGYTKDLVIDAITISNPTKLNYTYIAKCDNNLSFAWAKSSSGFYQPGEIGRYRLFLDNSNNLYEFGMVVNSITYGSATVNTGLTRQFLFKFDANGNTTGGYVLQNTYSDRAVVNQLGKVLTGSNSDGNFSITQFSNNMGQDWQKSSKGSTSGIATINNIKHDSAGNTYLQSRVTGYCNYFGTIINTGSAVTVISKHDSAGKLLWMNQIADVSPSIFGPTFMLDKDNNVITVGLYQTSMRIGTTSLMTSNGHMECYVAKYSCSGDFLWASNTDQKTNNLTNISVATDNASNVLVSGLNSPDNYLVKFDTNGNTLWAKSFPMKSFYNSLISTDANNNIYLTSEIHLSDYSISAMFGLITLNQSVSDGSTALIKFDPDGNALWAKTYGGVPGLGYSDGWACDIKTDASGNTYLWGWCPNNAVFGTYTLTNPIGTGYSLYLAKINTLGDVVWANAVYETKNGFNYGDLLDLDKEGNVYVGGHFTDQIRIEGKDYMPEGTNDFYAVKYSSTGLFQWIKTIPANSAIIKALSIKENDILSIAGYAGINSTLGSFNITRTSGSNNIVATLGNLTTGTKETYNSTISVFPNPVSSTLFLSGLTQNSTVSIFDLSGKLLINKSVITNQIDVSKLANGFYTIRIVDKNGITTKSIVKQ